MRHILVLMCVALASEAVFCSRSGDSRLTVVVHLPHDTPPGDTLCIAGNDSLLGNWDAGKIPMHKVSDTQWEIRVDIPTGKEIEFKITRGDWAKEALYLRNEIPSNISVTMVNDTTIELRPVAWRDRGFEMSGGITGTVRYHKALTGKGLTYPRDLIVWVPPTYDKESEKRYPVLYMHDGQNVFNPATSFTQFDWQVDEVVDSLIRAGLIRELIVVGVYNTPDRRLEYDDVDKGHAYMQFLINVVKPLIDSTYRTLPDRTNTATMGSSMGGLISFLLVWDHPEVFSQAGCLSPAFFDPLLARVDKFNGPPKDIRIYIDLGGIGLEKQLQPGCDRMLHILPAKGFAIGVNLEWYSDTAAEHNERAWAARIWRPLKFMFGR